MNEREWLRHLLPLPKKISIEGEAGACRLGVFRLGAACSG